MKNKFISGALIYGMQVGSPYVAVNTYDNYPIVIQDEKAPIPEKYSFIILENKFSSKDKSFKQDKSSLKNIFFEKEKCIYPIPRPFGEDWAGFYPTEFTPATEHKKIYLELKKPVHLEPSPLNPPIIIESYSGFNVIRDDLLVGGTKQRGLIYFIDMLPKSKPFIYAGPPQGIAQVALAYIGQLKNIKTYMVYAAPSKNTPIHNMSKKALRYNINLIWGGPTLATVQEYGKNLAKKIDGILLPFGLNDYDFKICLIRALRVACKHLIEKPPRRLWLVVGSGVILNCLYHVLPTTYFLGVQVGKAIWWDMIDSSRTRIFIAPQKFIEGTDILPPYPSVSSYDAKLWQFVIKYGETGDYIWNVANEL